MDIDHLPQSPRSKNLHEATLSQPLDFFILLPSLHSFIGNAGQSEYTAGYAYQVVLAKYRNNLGLPAMAIDLGIVGDVGYVVEKESGKNVKVQEFKHINEAEMLALIEMGIRQPVTGHLVTGLDSYLDIATMEKDGNMPFFARDPVSSHLDYFARISRPKLQCSLQTTGQAKYDIQTALINKLSRSLMTDPGCYSLDERVWNRLAGCRTGSSARPR